MNPTYNVYASAHIDGTIIIPSINIGILDGRGDKGIPMATFRVSAGVQSHPAYAMNRAAFKVFAYLEAARRFKVDSIEINLRANLVSAEFVSVLISEGDYDIEWHGTRDVRIAADDTYEMMVKKTPDSIPQNWPSTLIILPIFKPAIN